MCFVLAIYQVVPSWPLIVAANRDEQRSRLSSPPRRWTVDPPLWAGRDEVAGGTWLGVNSAGLLAAVTNRRDGGAADRSLPSRGQLCLSALQRSTPSAAQAFVEGELATRRYNPFNLLCASVHEGWVTTWRGDQQALTSGVHVLTNHGDLDDATQPAVLRARAAVAAIDLAAEPVESILAALGRLCADTTEPGPICRPGGAAGTVSSSLIAMDPTGAIVAYWHAEGPPSSHAYEPIDLTVPAPVR